MNLRLVIELKVDCIRCSKTALVFSTNFEVADNPLKGWAKIEAGWLCPKEDQDEPQQ